MDFALNEIQQELKQQARQWLGERYPLERDWEHQDDRWAELGELGWLDVAEADLGFLEEALLVEELGYALYPGPYLAHVCQPVRILLDHQVEQRRGEEDGGHPFRGDQVQRRGVQIALRRDDHRGPAQQRDPQLVGRRVERVRRVQQYPVVVDPPALVDEVLGPLASAETRQTIARAESRTQAFTMLLMSPEFQRR